MIDIHTHILPSVDDGSSDIVETFKIIHEACKAGFSDVFATSHYIEGEYEFNKTDREFIIEAIMEKVKKEGIDLNIHIGAEGYISNELPD